MLLTIGAACISFLVSGLSGLVLRRPGILFRLLLAFLVWSGWMIFFYVFLEEPESTAIRWHFGYGASLGTFLGAGTPWWNPRRWRLPSLRKPDFQLAFASRITFRAQRSISSLVVRLGIISIMLGVAVMEVSVSIVYGFQQAIQEKVIGFGSHIQIGNLLEEIESEVKPLPRHNAFIPEIARLENVRNVSSYVLKPCMLKSKTTQEGIVLKGVDSTYDWSFFQAAIREGTTPDVTKGRRYSKDILISRKLAATLDVGMEDKVFAYFFNDERGKVNVRQFVVTGIYETGLGEFDQVNAFCDLRAPQEIWGWEADQVTGFELWMEDVEDLDQLERYARRVEDILPYQYEAKTITREYPEIFEWVDLQHQNVWFILVLMVIIAVINMVSVILILILERTRTIGLLKALGMPNRNVQGLFVANALFLILIGLALGNLFGLALIWSQDYWGWLQVDQESYFVNVVPVMWKWDWFFAVNFGVLCVCTFFMYLPAFMVSRISAVRALRFD